VSTDEDRVIEFYALRDNQSVDLQERPAERHCT